MKLKNIAILWIIILFFFSTLPGRIEGIYVPVIKDFSFTILPSQFEKNASDIYISFYKIRPSCDFTSLSFFLHGKDENGNEQRVLMGSSFKGEETVRYSGIHNGVGPWVIMKNPSKLKDMTIVIEHECHGLYNTITKINIENGIYIGMEPLM